MGIERQRDRGDTNNTVTDWLSERERERERERQTDRQTDRQRQRQREWG